MHCLLNDAGACESSLMGINCPSRGQFRDRVWRPVRKGATAPRPRLQALFLRPQFRAMAAVRGRPSGLPGSFSSVRQPAYSCHPNRLATVSVVLQPKRTSCMLIRSLSRILASVLHRRSAPAPKPHRFYPICDLAHPTSNPRQVSHD